MHQGRKSTDKVHLQLLGKLVQLHRPFHVIVFTARFSHQGNGSYGNTLVDDRHTEFSLNTATSFYQFSCIPQDFLPHSPTAFLAAFAGTIPQGNPHGNGPHVQLVLHEHIYCLLNLDGRKNHWKPPYMASYGITRMRVDDELLQNDFPLYWIL